MIDPISSAVTLTPNPYYNLFCAGQAQLADGRILVVGGFALSRGYLMHFLLDDQTISRDQFYQLYEEAEQGKPIHIGCAQGDWTLGWLYVYESHCFTDDAALNAYMKQHFGSS